MTAEYPTSPEITDAYNASERWLHDYAGAYDVLFDDGRITKPEFEAYLAERLPREEAGIALSALARYTLPFKLPRGKVNILKSREKSLSFCIGRIVYANEHDEHGSEYDFLGTLEAKEFAVITGTAEQVFSAWMRTCLVREVEPPFKELYDPRRITEIDFGDREYGAVQLVLTTLAALHKKKIHTQRVDFTKLSKRVLSFAACGSPMPKVEPSAQEIPQELTPIDAPAPVEPMPAVAFPWRGRLKGLTPEQLARRQEAYEPANLARSLGWSEEKLATIYYSPYVRKQWTQSRDYEPEDAVARIKFLDEVLLTPPFLAKQLDITEEEVKAILIPRALAMAYEYPWKNPTPRFRRFIDYVHELYDAYPISLTAASNLALISQSHLARAKIELIQAYAAEHEHPERLQELPAYLPELSPEQIANRREAYSLKNLATSLGWSEKKVAEVCSPSMREAWVHRRIREPQEVITRLKYLDEKVLSSAALAERLKMSEAEVRSTFTPSVLKRFAYVTPWASPMPKLKSFLKRFREMTNVYKLDHVLARGVAFHVRSAEGARERAKTITEQADTCPSGYTKQEWAWATLHYPNPNFLAKRRKFIDAHRWVNSTRATDKIDMLARYVEVKLSGNVDDERVSEVLSSLVISAGLSQKEIQRLMLFYQEADKNSAIPEDIQQILARMQQVAKSREFKADF